MAQNKPRITTQRRVAAIQAALETQDLHQLKQLQRQPVCASEFRAVINAALFAGDAGTLHRAYRLWRADAKRKRSQLNQLWRQVAAKETAWQENH